MATDRRPSKTQLRSESAPRKLDPFEIDFLGVVRHNDPLLRDRGETIDAYFDLIRDGRVYANLQRRIAALVSRPWSVTAINPTDETSAEALADILKRIPFDHLCRDLMMALIPGYSVAEIIWDVVDGLWLPARMPMRKARRFVYVDQDDGRGPVLRLLTSANMTRGEALPERKFIVHRFDPRDDNPYGQGLGLYLFWPVYFKRRGIVSWAKFCDRFGTPTPWGRYPANASAGDKKTLADALTAFSNDGWVMTPDGALIELLEANNAGNITTQADLVRAMDATIAEVILGQESGQTNGGALAAAAKERQDVRLDLVQADADLLSETLNSTLIAWICDYNGLGACTVSRQIKEEVDRKAESETDINVQALGFELSEAAAREKYGDGWTKKPEAEAPKQAVTNFAEGSTESAQRSDDEQDPAARSVDRLQQDTSTEIDGWIDTLESMLTNAMSLEEFRAMLLAAFPSLPESALADKLTNAFLALNLRGRAEVIDDE